MMQQNYKLVVKQNTGTLNEKWREIAEIHL